MSEFASNEGTAAQHSLALKSSSGGSKSSVNYANETNITAVTNSKSKMDVISQQIESYKQLLSNDANNIGSLGAEFESLDNQIAAGIKNHF